MAINLLALSDIKDVMNQITSQIKPVDNVKEKAKTAVCLFQTMAEMRNIKLELRKK